MRVVRTMGAAVGIVGFATAVTLWAAQPQTPAAAQTQTTTQTQTQTKTRTATQTPKPATPPAGQNVEKEIIVEQRPGEPAIVIERQGSGQPRIVMRQGAGQGGGIYRPAMAGGGPRLGIEIRDVTKDDVAALKLPGPQGVVVAAVTKGSAAEKAGVKANDVLVTYDGETVRSAQQLTRLVGETAPGRAVKIALVRDGRRMELEAAPAEAPDEAVSVYVNPDQNRGDVQRRTQELREQLRQELQQYRFQRPLPAPGGEALRFRMERPLEGGDFQWFGQEGGPLEMLRGPGRGRLGVTVQELTPELATYFGVKDGVLVASVDADSPAAKAGIKAGDVITTVDDKPVTSAGEITVLLAVRTGEVPIGLTRDRKPLTLKATIEAPARRTMLRGSPA